MTRFSRSPFVEFSCDIRYLCEDTSKAIFKSYFMATRKKTKKTNWQGKVWRVMWRSIAAFLIITCMWVGVLRFINPPITFLMIQRSLTKDDSGNYRKIRQEWMDYDELSDNLKRAAIAAEDANFMTHFGFDINAIKEAYDENKSGNRLRGGSTISQQTAKNVFLWPQRSWVRKGFEAYFTLLIELLWGKKRILEVYLNVIETGNGLFGMESAAQHYFGHSAKKLTQRQAALLVAVLPNPRRWSPARPTAFINRKVNGIMRYMGHYQIP